MATSFGDVKAVIFDYNGVIVDDLWAHTQAYIECSAKHGFEVKESEMGGLMWTSHLQKRDWFIKKFGRERMDEDKFGNIYRDKTVRYRELVKSRDVLFPDAGETVLQLKEKFLLAIVTNTSRPQFDFVVEEPLRKQFKVIITAEEVEKHKPAPDSLLKAVKRLGVSPEECIYVGDAPADMEAAKNAGMRRVGITTGPYDGSTLAKAGASIVINNLKELLKVLGVESA